VYRKTAKTFSPTCRYYLSPLRCTIVAVFSAMPHDNHDNMPWRYKIYLLYSARNTNKIIDKILRITIWKQTNRRDLLEEGVAHI